MVVYCTSPRAVPSSVLRPSGRADFQIFKSTEPLSIQVPHVLGCEVPAPPWIVVLLGPLHRDRGAASPCPTTRAARASTRKNTRDLTGGHQKEISNFAPVCSSSLLPKETARRRQRGVLCELLRCSNRSRGRIYLQQSNVIRNVTIRAWCGRSVFREQKPLRQTVRLSCVS